MHSGGLGNVPWVIPLCEAGQQSEAAECTAIKRINITVGVVGPF